ncbi:hypothetical protein KIW84_014573 [Lathyrus oleraceus]|uniref:Uncharacterized protein n=1 Tax=Pisum sativum TaxID=3888 RepID=A0A9D5GZF0_PEA|nr:hypothetical protein KIW84_014573 [Pisum sativum]
MSKLYILAAASVVCAFDIPLEILLLFISALPHEFTDYGGKLRLVTASIHLTQFSQRLLQSDDKAFELNKLQISLYEEFFGKSIAAIPPVPVEVCKVNTDVSNAFFFTDIQNQNNSTDNGFTIHGTDTQKTLIDNVTRRSKDSPSNLLDNVTRDVTRGRDKKCFSAVK